MSNLEKYSPEPSSPVDCVLNAREEEFCRLYAGTTEGFGDAQGNPFYAAVEAGFDNQTARKAASWLKSRPEIQIYVAALCSLRKQEIQNRISLLADAALNEVESVMRNGEDDSTRLQAAKFILGVAGHTAKIQTQSAPGNPASELTVRIEKIKEVFISSTATKMDVIDVPLGAQNICKVESDHDLKTVEIETENKTDPTDDEPGHSPGETSTAPTTASDLLKKFG